MLLKASGPARVITDPELKFSAAGKPYASFRVVTDKKKKNEATGQWEDDKVMFARVTCFGPLAEHLAGSVIKGDTIVLTDAEVHVSEWDKNDGSGKGYSVEIVANEVGVSLRWNEVTPQRDQQRSGGNQQSAPQQDGGPWGGGNVSDEPPF